jgi:hypothetical protein
MTMRGGGAVGACGHGALVCVQAAKGRGGEARKRWARTRALWHWGCGRWCWEARGGGAGPHPLEHEAQPPKSDQHQLGEQETGDYGKTPSYRGSNKGIVPGFQTAGMSRMLEVHGLMGGPAYYNSS